MVYSRHMGRSLRKTICSATGDWGKYRRVKRLEIKATIEEFIKMIDEDMFLLAVVQENVVQGHELHNQCVGCE